MKWYKSLFILFMFLVIPVSANASECDYKAKARLQQYAANLTYKLDYEIKDDNATFKLLISNLTDEIYIKDKDSEREYHYEGSSEILIEGIDPGVKKTLYIYPEEEICYFSYKSTDLSLLATKYKTAPYYNKYYKDERCESKESLEVCSMLTVNKITKTRFENGIKDKEDGKKDDDKDDETEISLFEKFLDFFINYYIYILSTIIILGILIIFILRNNDNYDFS